MGLLLVRILKVSLESMKALNGIVSILRDSHIGRERFSCMSLHYSYTQPPLRRSLFSPPPLSVLLLLTHTYPGIQDGNL